MSAVKFHELPGGEDSNVELAVHRESKHAALRIGVLFVGMLLVTLGILAGIQDSSTGDYSISMDEEAQVDVAECLAHMEAASITPLLINSVQGLFQLNWAYENPWQCGCEVTKAEVQPTPTVTFDDGGLDKYYTLMMVCMDMPTPNEPIVSMPGKSFAHWQVLNVRSTGLDSSADTVLPYFPPGLIPEQTGPHRFVFLLFEQNGPVDASAAPAPDRVNFDVKQFQRDLRMGPPVAGSFFFAHGDDYVEADACVAMMRDNGIIGEVVPDVQGAFGLDLSFPFPTPGPGPLFDLFGVTIDHNIVPTNCGDTVNATTTPNVAFLDDGYVGSYYSLVAVDADAPPPYGPLYLHWLAVNVPSDEGLAGAATTVVNPFVLPAPPEGTGAHRYCFFLYKQPGGRMRVPDSFSNANFDLDGFVSSNGLGDPIAAKFFYSSYESTH